MANLKVQRSNNVTHISVARTTIKLNAQKSEPVRKFVPFNGFDGQYLSGSGALVFEGELLKRRG